MEGRAWINIVLDFGELADWTLVILTAAIVGMTILNWQITARMKWLTGALERHSDQQRQIAAHNAGVRMRWWDKEIGGEFPHEGEHNQVHRLKLLYIGIPPHKRIKKSWWVRFRRWACPAPTPS